MRKSLWVAGLMVFLGLIGSAQATPAQVWVHSEAVGDTIINRERLEGPRGGNNERPGDRQRRGGRHGEDIENIQTVALDADLISREASSRGRGRDNRRPHF